MFGVLLCLSIALLIVPQGNCQNVNAIENRIKFIFYDSNNEEVFASKSQNDSLASEYTGCDPSQPYALIVHGWRESCNTAWAIKLRENLIKHRGGCIICMDYSSFSPDYGFLMSNFKNMAKILTSKLLALREYSFRSRTAYMFGFSFGARLIAQAGNDLGPSLIGRIDLCEPAGPGFENSKLNADPKLAAKYSQCIHTAVGGFGTRERICHQNWMMGSCGEAQAAARPFPNGNHGLCPVFYNSAFDHVFAAVMKNETCQQALVDRDAVPIALETARMGYWQNYLNNVSEITFYAKTTRDPPYNEESGQSV